MGWFDSPKERDAKDRHAVAEKNDVRDQEVKECPDCGGTGKCGAIGLCRRCNGDRFVKKRA